MPPAATAADVISLRSNRVYAFRVAERLGGGRVLIDAGPDYEGAWEEAVGQGYALGFAPQDVRAVIVTHGHADHAGLAHRWAEAGARIFAGAPDMTALTSGDGWREYQARRGRDELRRHGCPPATLERIEERRRERSGALRWKGAPWGSVAPAVGDHVFPIEGADGEASLRIVSAPGHTPGNLGALVGETGELYGGDTLLPGRIPSAGLHFHSSTGTPRWPSLPPYLGAVEWIAGLSLARLLPAHGAPGGAEDEAHSALDPATEAQRFLTHHRRREARVRAALGASAADGATAYELARAIFPRLPEERIGQAMTEVIGHLDVLLADGAAERTEDGEGWHYARLAEGGARPCPTTPPRQVGDR
jgi:glyoxylase-like metal-dependent hydrolase (beta-lactamase superfamily II)